MPKDEQWEFGWCKKRFIIIMVHYMVLKRQWIGCWQRPLHQRDAVEAICPPFGLLRKNLLKWWKGITKFLAGLDKPGFFYKSTYKCNTSLSSIIWHFKAKYLTLAASISVLRKIAFRERQRRSEDRGWITTADGWQELSKVEEEAHKSEISERQLSQTDLIPQ